MSLHSPSNIRLLSKPEFCSKQFPKQSILAIETATEYCSAALLCGETILQQQIQTQQQHSQHILAMLEALLTEAGISKTQLDAIAFGCGPGSFTGIRLATSVAQAIAFTLDIPIIPVSTLRALAQAAYRIGQHPQVLSAIDARLQQIYWGPYQLGSHQIMEACQEECVCYPESVTLPYSAECTDMTTNPINWIGVGSGWDRYHQVLQPQLATKTAHSMPWLTGHYPQAQDIAILAQYAYQQGHWTRAVEVTPVYLRNNIAKQQKELKK